MAPMLSSNTFCVFLLHSHTLVPINSIWAFVRSWTRWPITNFAPRAIVVRCRCAVAVGLISVLPIDLAVAFMKGLLPLLFLLSRNIFLWLLPGLFLLPWLFFLAVIPFIPALACFFCTFTARVHRTPWFWMTASFYTCRASLIVVIPFGFAFAAIFCYFATYDVPTRIVIYSIWQPCGSFASWTICDFAPTLDHFHSA